MVPTFSRRSAAATQSLGNLDQFMVDSTWSRRRHEPNIADFTFGNPHEMPLGGLVDALRDWVTPLNKDWFAYKMSERGPREVVAATLRARHGLPFEADDVALTNGGFGAIATAMRALADPGDEVIFSVPGWFFYEPIAIDAGLESVKVALTPGTFDLDLDAIERAITPRTRIVIVNSPHNPTGRVYAQATFRRLACMLCAASERHGKPVYLLSDEPYRHITYDGARAASPVEAYPFTLIAYSYGKTLLAPGQRIGYLALAPQMPERERARQAIMVTQMAAGWLFPNALLQHALGDIEGLTIDVGKLQRRRDILLDALRGFGYDVHTPQGAFYLLPKSPIPDDEAFIELLAEQDVFALPGSRFDLPGYFRLCLTASDEMVARALPGFDAATRAASAIGVGQDREPVAARD